ncbi:hypothetical protein BC567DRAFT_273882, partial [Phyllosticta citribraziliensis]
VRYTPPPAIALPFPPHQNLNEVEPHSISPFNMSQTNPRDNQPQRPPSPSQQRQAVTHSLAHLTLDATDPPTSHIQQQLAHMAVDTRAAAISQMQQGVERLAVDKSSAGVSQLRYGVATMQVDSSSIKKDVVAMGSGFAKMSLKRRFEDLELADDEDSDGGRKKARVYEFEMSRMRKGFLREV